MRARSGRVFSTRLHVLALAFTLVVPVLSAAGVLAYRFAAAETARVEQSALHAARIAAATVDRELEGMIVALQVLTSSRVLTNESLPEFYKQAAEVAALQDAVVVLRTPSHEQLVNTALPWGSELPHTSRLAEADERAAAEGRAVASGYYMGSVKPRPSIAVVLPIMREGRIAWFLSAGFDVKRIRAALRENPLPENWRAVAVDHADVTIALTSDREAHGRPFPAGARLGGAREAFWRDATVENEPYIMALRRTAYGWTVAVGAPEELLHGAFAQAVAATAFGALLLIALALASALLIAGRISSPMAALAGMGAALGRGDSAPVPSFGNTEANSVARSLADASVRLKERERDLQVAEQRYRRLFNSIDEGFCVIEMIRDSVGRPVDYRFLEVNPLFEQQTGLTNAAGRTARQMLPNLEQYWIDTYDRVARTGQTVRFEQGSEAMGRWFSVYASRVEDDGRGLVAVVFSDITDRRLAEEALIASERRYKAALRLARIGAWETNFATGVRRWSEEGMALFGLKLKDGIGVLGGAGDEAFALVHPDDRDLVKESLKSLWTNDTAEVVHRIVRPDGEVLWLHGHGEVTTRGRDGAPVVVLSVAKDITERKRQEEALRESKARLSQALDAGELGVHEWNIRTGRISWDDRLRALWGIGPDAPITTEFFERSLHPDDRARIMQQIREALNPRGSGRFHAEYRIVLADGAVRWISAHGVITFVAGRAVQIVGTACDISARKKAEEQRTLLIHELNHRVKNTLATVQSVAVQTLRRRRVDPAVRQIFESRLFALGAAHDVLTRENWEGADLSTIVHNAVQPFMADAARRPIKGPKVRLTPNEALTLAMALHELATNAVKHGAWSTHQGRVSIAWTLSRTPGARTLTLSWREEGGPPVARPDHGGFGSRLLEQGLALEFGQGARIIYDPQGLRCEIVAALADPSATR